MIPHRSQRWKALYRRRSAVEREVGRLKHNYSLLPLRVRGLDRVQVHALLCVVTRLANALASLREQVELRAV